MTVPVGGLGAVGPVRAVGPRPRTGASFRMPEEAGAGAARAAEGSAAVSAPSLLALQEEDAGTVADRKARRHGQAMLAALAALQRDMLGGIGPEAALTHLASLARAMPDAADPRLAAVQQAIRVRVAVEMARVAARR